MKPLMAVLAALVVLGSLGAIIASIRDFRTEELTQTFVVTTSSIGTTANVSLSKGLFESNIVHASATSNRSTDAPVSSTYTAGTQQLLIAGLIANVARTLTVTYKAEALAEYEGADAGVRFLPFAILLALVIIPLVAVIMAFLKRT